MHQILTQDYWTTHTKGRPLRDSVKAELTLELRGNAGVLLQRVNLALKDLQLAEGELTLNPATGTLLASGWRPRYYNSTIPTAAVNSKHITAQALDLYDPDGMIDDWFFDPEKLQRYGLWMEHPAATKGWCHLQSVPPKSGRLVFYP